MIKKNQRFFVLIQVILDLLVVAVMLYLAWYVRFDSPFMRDGVKTLELRDYTQTLLFVLPIDVVLFFLFGMYKPFRKQRFYKEVRGMFLAVSAGTLILLAVLYIVKNIHFSRYVLGFFYVFSLVGLTLERGVIRKGMGFLRSKGYNIKYIIIIGAGKPGRSFAKKMADSRQLGYKVCGFLDDEWDKDQVDGLPLLGGTKDIHAVLEANRVDEVIIALPNAESTIINAMIDECEFQGIKTMVIPDYYHLIQGGTRAVFDELDGIPLINTRYIPLDEPFNNFIKRFFDILISLLILIVLLPLMLIVAILVKVTSPGPIIYKQVRLGINRREFEIYKFRSMRNDIPEVGETTWTTENDPRKTKIGSFIRKTSIDELPQFVNILKGDMSLIGPRPERPFYVNQFKEEIPQYMIKHHVRPGLTGWAQVNGWRGDTDIEPRIRCDIEYIENWSIWFDIKIILMTPKALVKSGY